MTNVLLLYILNTLYMIISLLQKDPILSVVFGWISCGVGLVALIALAVEIFKEKR